MDIEFARDDLSRMETDPSFRSAFSKETVRAYRKRLSVVRAAKDERDLYALRSNHFEKLHGKREGQCSLRVNDQWRIIVEIVPGTPKNTIRVLSLEDYH
ncbi:type II toxin-antitoxin system RelE/ParE family toxin [Candidatus Sumerlaeota bacterium]|nr:type II toxin-antitoxin system RelE/ParE family toxin [Candidatus Sumerlaeota bacterium]